MSATTDTDTGANERPRLLPRESIAKNLFVGEILEENLFPYPAIRSRDREMLGSMVEAIDGFLADKAADFRRWDREAHQPAEFIQSLREMGLFGLIIPEEYGGLELSNARLCARARPDQQLRQLGVAHDRRAQFDRHEGHPAVRHRRAEGSATCRGSRPAR